MAHANDEEKQLIEQMIFLPLVKKVLKYNANMLAAHVKLPQPYLQLNEHIFQLVSRDLQFVKREVYKRRIKVFEESRDSTTIVYKTYVRGYEETHRYAFIILKNKTEQYLIDYLQKFTEKKSL